MALGVLAAAFVAAALGRPDPAQAAYTAKVKAGALTIAGDGASDTLVLRLQSGSPTTLQVDVGGDGTANFSFDRTKFTTIDVQAGRGDDLVRIDQSGGAFPDESVTLSGGPGADTLLGGSGSELLVGGEGDDLLAGGDANDRALLGDGTDRFAWNPGDDSDVVDGGRGDDVLDFNGTNASETIGVAASGDHVRFTRDVAAIVTDLDGVERIAFDAAGGTDTITVADLTGTDARTVDLDLSAVGGGGDAAVDTVITSGTPAADNATIGSADGRIVFGGLAAQTRIAGGEAHDELTLATLGGADTINAGVSLTGPAPVNVHGGDAADALRYSGTPGGDTISSVANGLEVSTYASDSARVDSSAVESVTMLGLAGADTISAVGNLAALTSLTFDGGEDGDTLLGGNGADVLLGGGGNDALDGNQGADQVLSGDGDDRFQWDPGDGSDTAVDGQAGNDLLDFNGSGANENIAVAANGQLARLTRDIAAITLDLASLEHVAVHVFGGTDTINVYPFAGIPVGMVDVDLGTIGGGGDAQIDNVLVHGTANADSVSVGSSAGSVAFSGLASQVRVAGGEAHDEVTLATNAGEDTITAAIGIPGATPVNLDGGGGGDTVRYEGTSGDDTIPVVANGAEVSIAEAASARVDTSAVENLTLLGQAGADTISAVGNLAALIALTFDGGEDADTLLGSNGTDLLLGGDGADHVDGQQGADNAFLGDGDDTFQWDPGDSSDTVEGQAGTDRLDFNGSNAGELIDVSANTGRVRFTRNIAAIVTDLAGVERIGFDAFGGADTITVNDLAGTDATTVDVDLNIFGGGGDSLIDTVLVHGTAGADNPTVGSEEARIVLGGLAAQTRIAGGEAIDELTLATLAGADTISAGVGLTGAAPVNVDGGAELDTVSYSGTGEADSIQVAANGLEVTTSTYAGSGRLDTSAVESLVLLGQAGADTISAVGNLAALIALTFDGGEDADTLLGSNGTDLLLGGDGADHVDGQQGADNAFLGDGDDTFQWDPGDSSDTVEGQAGTDRLDFNGSNAGELIDVSANTGRVRFTRNIAAIVTDLAGVERIGFDAFGGADTITVNDLAGTDATSVDVDLNIFGGGGDAEIDTVVVNGTGGPDVVDVTRSGAQVLAGGLAAQTRIVGSEAVNDTLSLRTLGGNDSVVVAPDVIELITTAVDLGADE